MRLLGRVVVITGAASGIGRAMAAAFAAEGAKVVAADILQERLGELAAELANQGHEALTVRTDVSATADVEALIDTTMDKFGHLDVLCNNAGIMDRSLLVDEVSEDLWERVLRTNLTGPYLACHRAVPIMLKQGRGVITNTASVAGIAGGRAGAAYTASKHGLVGLTKNIAATFADQGIRCNAICPGQVRTNIVNYAPGEPESVRFRQAHGGESRRSRTAEPEEVARVAAFLASDDASFINGSIITVDGGNSAA